MIATALLGLALIAPADTPIEPIDSATIDLLEYTDEGQALCVEVGNLAGMVEVWGILLDNVEFGDMINEMSTAYFAHSFETGFGPDSAMTQEAEADFYEWVEGCRV